MNKLRKLFYYLTKKSINYNMNYLFAYLLKNINLGQQFRQSTDQFLTLTFTHFSLKLEHNFFSMKSLMFCWDGKISILTLFKLYFFNGIEKVKRCIFKTRPSKYTTHISPTKQQLLNYVMKRRLESF